ncbi:hypothetical protein OFB92_30040, partial [Escherichia coli]|nr:hypothetical protein [Escherichia coli]
AAEEALDMLAEDGIFLDSMRVRAFPFGKEFCEFIERHKKLFIIEQNRDAQFRSLVLVETAAEPDKLISVLNYDGTPVTADFIYEQIKSRL